MVLQSRWNLFSPPTSKCYFNAPPMAPTTPMAPPQALEEQDGSNSLVIKLDDGLNLGLKINLRKTCLPEKLRSPKGEHTGEEHGTTNSNERPKVQWTDAHGQDLIQIKEFESRYARLHTYLDVSRLTPYIFSVEFHKNSIP